MFKQNVHLAIEGCGHGTLHAIYASVAEASKEKGWENGPDLVIIGGDFQAVRNADDLTAMSVPRKYREIGDFHEYYSGHRVAPYLTLFVGGNHEASNHLFELYYGGWAAPNIYYLGAANVLRFGPLRIAGLSGIWKGYNYRKPHYERLPFSEDDVKSIYHIREFDVRKLLQIRTQVDIGVSHDWPKNIEWLGNWRQLFRFKPHFEEDAKSGRLGSQAARYVLDRLRPRYWFSAHLHCKYAAMLDHSRPEQGENTLDVSTEKASVAVVNTDQIDVDVDDGEKGDDEGPNAAKLPTKTSDVSAELRAQLPKTFSKVKRPELDLELRIVPPGITNTTTQFLALDKCLPRRRFLQLMEIPAAENSSADAAREDDAAPKEVEFKLTYDPEWLAINRVFAPDLKIGDHKVQVPPTRDYSNDIKEAQEWIAANVVQQNLLEVPSNFEPTAPFYDAVRGINAAERPKEYTNPQTTAYCSLLDISNPFNISEEERQARLAAFLASEEQLRDIGSCNGRTGDFRGGGNRGGRYQGRKRAFGRR